MYLVAFARDKEADTVVLSREFKVKRFLELLEG